MKRILAAVFAVVLACSTVADAQYNSPGQAGPATAANQATGNASLSTVVTNTGTSATAAGTPADGAYSGSGSSSIVAALKGLYNKLAGTLTVSGTVTQPDTRAAGQTLNSATANVAVTAPLNNGEGVVGWTVSGLAASGATLTAEASNDGGTTWSPVNLVGLSTGALSPTTTADGQYRTNASGHTQVRLRVSATGAGTITVSYSASSVSGLFAASGPLQTRPSTVTQIGATCHLTLSSLTASGLSSCPGGIPTNTTAVVFVGEGANGTTGVMYYYTANGTPPTSAAGGGMPLASMQYPGGFYLTNPGSLQFILGPGASGVLDAAFYQ